MKTSFMSKDFLLSTDTARMLYHNYAARMPIIDYHCHIDPQQILEDKKFADLTELWLGGDHYKWRVMRANGVEEKYITGKDTAPYEKFERWAAVMPRLIGNPLYHWTHLELQRYFNIYDVLSPTTCKKIWDEANEQLKSLSVRKIIELSNVKAICTTDDPADDLHVHRLLKEDKSLFCQVLPAFRPDKAMNIDKAGFVSYLDILSNAAGTQIKDMASLELAIDKRLEYFVSMGCVASDHGLDYIMFEHPENTDEILKNALQGKPVSRQEADMFKTELMCHLAGRYRELGIVMQLHYGAVRNNNPKAFASLGADTGFDAIGGGADSGSRLGALLGEIDLRSGLPKTIVYSLNPTDNAQIASIIGCFQSADHPGYMQHGSAWWFNDTESGMTQQLVNLANSGVLGNFVGMLTDSRSFLSYTRHEYFRRILCDLFGSWAESGRYPQDMDVLGQMVEDISYNNTKTYFGLEMEDAL